MIASVSARAAQALMILAIGGLLASAGPAAAQDSDEFYRIARGESGRRPVAAAPSGGGFNFFGLFGGGRRREAPEITVRPRDERDQRPRDNAEQARSDSGENVGGPRAYCVRTCDGFFFPMGPATAGSARDAQQASCNAMCPGAETVLYSVARQGTIEDATNARGQPYTALRTAFRFRQSIDRTCSCQSMATSGLARLPVTHDPTLRPGDVVVTDEGARVFRGGARFPYRAQDFVAARAYGRLPADLRRRVDEIEAGLAASGSGRLPARSADAGTVSPPSPISIPVTAASASPVRVIDISQSRSAALP
jgi:hypothetical protein